LSVLQCVAVCCSVLQCVAVCCCVLQCVAVCCSVLQGVVVCCRKTIQHKSFLMFECVAMCCSVLQCVTVCCSVLQKDNTTQVMSHVTYTLYNACIHFTTRIISLMLHKPACNTLQHTAATHCNILQHIEKHTSLLSCHAEHKNIQ